MRVLLTTFGSRGDVQPVLALAVALRALGADARVCAPPDAEFAKLFAAADVPLLPAFTSVREWIAQMIPKRATISLAQLAAPVMTAQYDAIDAAVRCFGEKRCEVIIATGLSSSVAAARTVAEKLSLRYVHAAYCPMFLPSPYQRPIEYPSHPHPPGVTDNQVLWDRDVHVMNELFGPGLNNLRASVGMPNVDNVRDYMHGDRPLLAADPVLAPWRHPTNIDVAQTGDQPYWAGRVWDLGIGSAHDGPTPTPESLATALESALKSGTRARALAIAGSIRIDGAMRAAKLLLEASTD